MSQRLQRGLTKMSPGTFGGQSRAATPLHRRQPFNIKTLRPPDFTLTCPTLVADVPVVTVPIFGGYPEAYGACTWDGGTKITLWLDFAIMATFSYPDFTLLDTVNMVTIAPPTFQFYQGNFAVTDEGLLFLWGVLASTDNFELFRYDLVGGGSVTSVYDLDVYGSSIGATAIRVDGPAYNPYDGYIWDMLAISGGPNTLRLARWDPANPSAIDVVDDLETYSNVTAVGDTLTFTQDGGVWLSYGTVTPSSGGSAVARRWQGGTLQSADYDTVAASDGIPIPYDTERTFWNSVLYGGIVFSPDMSHEPTDCEPFAGADFSDGTVQVHSGIDGLTTFIWPTFGGAGRYIYEQRSFAP